MMLRTTLAAAFALTTSLALVTSAATAKDKDKIEVKPLQVKGLPFNVGGGNAVTTVKSKDELEKVAGKKAAQELVGQVDFQKQEIVFVSWTTSGPPFGKLEFEVIGKDKDRVVEFYIREPKANARGQAARIGADFFAVPKETKVRLGKSR
jgi:hypothetical protein